jgi:hypothetical protein
MTSLAGGNFITAKKLIVVSESSVSNSDDYVFSV